MAEAQDEPNMPERAAPPWAQPGARPLLRFEGVRKSFGGIVAVDGVTLDIFEREFFALFRPSGCGKTRDGTMPVGCTKWPGRCASDYARYVCNTPKSRHGFSKAASVAMGQKRTRTANRSAR